MYIHTYIYQCFPFLKHQHATVVSFHLATNRSCQADRVTCVTEVRYAITVSIHTYVHMYVIRMYVNNYTVATVCFI